MEENKLIAKCDYCGFTKEVVPIKDSEKKICADCAIELWDRRQGHFLPVANYQKSKNVKEILSCQQLAVGVIEL
jgi:hypothetical protein